MVRLKVSVEGQITISKEVLDQLGVKPGDEVEVDTTCGKLLQIRPAQKKAGTIEDFFGSLKNKHNIRASLDDINDAIEAGWAGEVQLDDDR